MKLGKLPARRSLKTLSLSNYMATSRVTFPPVCAWERPIAYGMLANDTVGDCTIAGAAHMVMNWQAVANAGTLLTFTDDQVLKDYSALSAYDPTNGANDNGCVELDVLNYWRDNGICGHKIDGYVAIDFQNIDMVKAACYLFGGVYMGFHVPDYIMDGRKTWEARTSPNYVGDHAVPIFGYGRAGCAPCSWGDIYHMNWDFWMQNVDEAYAVVAPEFIKACGISPTGLDLNGLLNDLQLVKQA